MKKIAMKKTAMKKTALKKTALKKTIMPPGAWIVALAACCFQPAAQSSPAAAAAAAAADAAPSTAAIPSNPLRNAYYGDLHLHTSYSFDAYFDAQTKVDPDEAYRFARGDLVDYMGQPTRRREPLDFMAVTDHAESIGVLNELEDGASVVSRSGLGQELKAYFARMTQRDGLHNFSGAPKDQVASLLDRMMEYYRAYFKGNKNSLPEPLAAESASAWQREMAFANRNYQPGKFTTFIAYEWTSTPTADNLHRNVIFRGNSAPAPFTALDSKRPEDLWAWLEAIRKQGFEALAIPHNGNASNGLMYDWVDTDGLRIGRAYAERRQANEPLSEISQIKGSSETNPLLSPNDEFAGFEIYDFYAGVRHHVGRPQGSYLRDALGRGEIIQRQFGVNPFKYGFVGGSDLHGGLSVSAQADFAGNQYGANLGGGKPSAEDAARVLSSRDGDIKLVTAGNLTGVWAERNTRESLYDALRRRETFATTGTKLKFRFFGGWDYRSALLQRHAWVASAYANGVPMGGDLPVSHGEGRAPVFAIWAVKDPNGANLDRAQIIKVWEEDGQSKEKVFDVAWSGTRKPDAVSGKVPAVGDTVDLKTGAYSNSIGATELKAVWRDPEFDALRYAAYYLRVLEIPTPRWTTLLAAQHGLPLPKDVPATVQQRGWSSPIWYSPDTRP